MTVSGVRRILDNNGIGHRCNPAISQPSKNEALPFPVWRRVSRPSTGRHHAGDVTKTNRPYRQVYGPVSRKSVVSRGPTDPVRCLADTTDPGRVLTVTRRDA